MKKYLSIVVMTIILLSLCACSSNSNKKAEDNSTTKTSNVSQDNSIETDDITDTKEINASESTVLIRYFRQRKELPYNDKMKNILNDIEQCEDKPKTEFVNKIGSISIRNNDEGSEDFANIYIGEDENIYARCINNSDEKIAYKLDINAFGLE